MAKLKIRIYPNGEIKAETVGVKGKNCLKYIPVVEKLTNAQVTDSEFTKEYLETENTINTQVTGFEEVKL